MNSNNDRVINVPIPDDDVIKNVTSLPRTRANDGFITVNLKRMKSMKKEEMKETLNPQQLLDGLEYLRSNHPDYKDVTPRDIIEEFLESEESDEEMDAATDMEECKVQDLDSDTEMDLDCASVNNDNDHDSDDDENVYCSVTCLLPDNPQEKVLINDSDKTIKKKTKITSSITTDIAPGEGKTPTNYMREENFLETAFPRHYPMEIMAFSIQERKSYLPNNTSIKDFSMSTNVLLETTVICLLLSNTLKDTRLKET